MPKRSSSRRRFRQSRPCVVNAVAAEPFAPVAPRQAVPHGVVTRVQERLQILFLNVQEDDPLDRLGLPPYREWIATAAGVRLDQVTVVRVADGEPLPRTVEQHGIIGGGSGHSSTERLPWIIKTKEFFNFVEERQIPQLHICWSHQAKAESIGAICDVGKAGRRIGVEQLVLTSAGRQDPLFADLPDSFELFTSHRDAIHSVPDTAASGAVTELAYSTSYRHESLAIGNATRTLQAHPEVTSDVIVALAAARRTSLIEEGLLGASREEFDDFVEGIRRRGSRIRENGYTVVRNWVHHYVARATQRTASR